MNLNESFDVRPEKLAALKERIARLGLKTELIEETFARGGGKGQKVNKTSNAVHLKYRRSASPCAATANGAAP